MSKMCQACDLGQTTPVSSNNCSIPLCKACEERNTASSVDENSLSNSFTEVNGPCPLAALMTSSSAPLSNCGSRRSSYDDIPTYANSLMRNDEADGLDTGLNHQSPGIAEHMQEYRLSKDISVKIPYTNHFLSGLTSPLSSEDNYTCNSLASGNCKDIIIENNEKGSNLSTDGQSIRSVDDSHFAENVVNTGRSSVLLTGEYDPHIWTPPEPENMEYDTDSSAYDDEDDDYNDGTPWGKPSSLSSLDEVVGNHPTYKEERQKAMMEAMNGQFKILVCRLLDSEGMGLSDGEGGKNWVDIITSLSWDAALLIKPGPNEGRAMDPGSYVKVKCIASGTRSESQLIKGLVFKKNTKHKHMPTKLKNPKILLLRGSLIHSAIGLSSLGSMKEEEDYKKAFIDMIESCRPHMVLVEKAVPRDIQELLLDRGITLIFDMKISRLERIARCLDSEIISSADILSRPKLKQCDSFHIEKFVEEHNCSCEGGKKPSKTLMFLEGCPRPLGCTILLKGAHTDELKKVKRVVQYTVFAAYHLILETSFFADQRTFFYDMNAVKEFTNASANKSVNSESSGGSISHFSNVNGRITDAVQLHALDIPIFDGSVEGLVHGVKFSSDLDGGSSMVNTSRSLVASVGDETAGSNQVHDTQYSHEIIESNSAGQALAPGRMLSSVSASLKKFLGEKIPINATDSISSYCGFNEKLSSSWNRTPVSPHPEASDHVKEANEQIRTENLDNESDNGKNNLVNLDQSEVNEQCSERIIDEVQIEGKYDTEGTVDPQSILVLLSSYCIPKQMVCEQSHFSRIKYYGNFDISLGRYLQDILLNQKHTCSSCGEPPEHHLYSYTHRNGNITVRVRTLPKVSTLQGETEGKIWMWTRCLKCREEDGTTKATRRVVMSSAARGLSFGKFLELSFSGHSAANRLSKCGHLLHRDCLRFFGLGSKVAMFRYSSIEIFSASKPSPVLEFSKASQQEWFAREARDVLSKGDVFFMEVADELEKVKRKCSSNSLLKHSVKSSGLAVEFDKVEEMVVQEKTDFEASLLNSSAHGRQSNDEICDINWRLQELLLLLYVWDRRLHYISQCWSGDAPNDEKQIDKANDAINPNNHLGGSTLEDGREDVEIPIQIPSDAEESFSSSSRCRTNNEDGMETEPAEASAHIIEMGCVDSSGSTTDSPTNTANYSSLEGKCSLLSEDHLNEDNSIPILIGTLESAERTTESDLANDKSFMYGENNGGHKSHKSEEHKLEDPERWIWSPFSELRKIIRKDLLGGFLHKFEFINRYKPTYLSPMHQLVPLVTDTLHFPVGPDDSVVSVVEDEISSIICCALALLKDLYGLDKVIAEAEEKGDGKGETGNATDSSHPSTSSGSMPSAHVLSSGASEPEKVKPSRILPSMSSDDLTAFSSDGTLFADGLIASAVTHPQIPLGSGKLSGRCKFSVVCVFAKEFYCLRKRCCSSELAYISSLSRCRKWDAQGGKSKVLFAKTMDDRLIIKQIKKAELESFLVFGPKYFKHINTSLDSGSQTCLAKILGIYQVRQFKGGKETKTDLLVMENLFFGRNISRKYDLKGAVFSRYVSNSKDSESVLLDENFVEDMRISPIYVGGRNKHLLQRAIWNDTSFLTTINVMDYSLLVGVDKENHEIVFGIIDYLRQYTWDKQLETWVKASLIVPKNELPTVISPKEYKNRFRKFMTRYFLCVPDAWNSEQCSGSCKFCINGTKDPSNLHTESCQSRKIRKLA